MSTRSDEAALAAIGATGCALALINGISAR